MTVEEKSLPDIAASIELLEVIGRDSGTGGLGGVIEASLDEQSPLFGRYPTKGETLDSIREKVFGQPILKLAETLDEMLADFYAEYDVTPSEMVAVLSQAIFQIVKPPPS